MALDVFPDIFLGRRAAFYELRVPVSPMRLEFLDAHVLALPDCHDKFNHILFVPLWVSRPGSETAQATVIGKTCPFS